MAIIIILIIAKAKAVVDIEADGCITSGH